MATINSIVSVLKKEGYPITLVKGNGYYYFVYDDGEVFETESVCINRLNSMPTEFWLITGRQFAKAVQERYQKDN